MGVADVKRITEACAEDMISAGIEQWNKDYPSLEIITKDAQDGNLFGYETDGKIVGSVMFSMIKDHFYSNINWKTKDSNHIYVHRLAVHPHYQRQGIARQLMDFGENLGGEKGCCSVRLDTFSLNPRNNKFYKNREYLYCGDVYFDHKSNAPFYCFELIL